MADLQCGRCGYNVRGLPSSTCPECGSDLDVVGRVSVASLWQKRILRFTLFAVLAVWGPSAIIFIADRWLIPWNVTQDMQVVIGANAPESCLVAELRFASSAWFMPGKRVDQALWPTCSINLAGTGRQPIAVDLATFTFGAPGADGRPSGSQPLTPDTLAAWAASCGVDAKPETIRDGLRVVVDILRSAASPTSPLACSARTHDVREGALIHVGRVWDTDELLVDAGIDTSPLATVLVARNSGLTPIVPWLNTVRVAFRTACGACIVVWGTWLLVRFWQSVRHNP